MILTRRGSIAALGAACCGAAFTGRLDAQADEPAIIEVQMLNRHPETDDRMVFHPAVIRARVGDTIRFLSTDRGHNSEATEGMLPPGIEAWRSRINDDFELALTADGTYGYHCTPHKTVGMVGLILVGDAFVNFEAARAVRHRGRAKSRFDLYFAEAEDLLRVQG